MQVESGPRARPKAKPIPTNWDASSPLACFVGQYSSIASTSADGKPLLFTFPSAEVFHSGTCVTPNGLGTTLPRDSSLCLANFAGIAENKEYSDGTVPTSVGGQLYQIIGPKGVPKGSLVRLCKHRHEAYCPVVLGLSFLAALLFCLNAARSDEPSNDLSHGGWLDTNTYNVSQETKKFAWEKGDYRIVPYGALWGSAIYSTERAVPGPFILYVASATAEGEDYFVIDTRRSRVGFDIAGPRVPLMGYANSGAKVEVDFQAALGTAEGLRVLAPENQTAVQIRHAYAEVKNDEFRLMAGQTWDLVSPLNPGMLTYAVGWGGGNIGFRRMQIRYERYLQLTHTAKLTLQGAMAQDIALDFIQYAESANWPILQGRCGLDCQPVSAFQPLSVGVSGHIGEQGFDFPSIGPLPAQDDARIETWSFNVDVRWPFTSRMGVQGEFFTGKNLSAFLGGIIQGINPVTRRAIATTGGWGEFWYDWSPRLHTHLGYGIDDPSDRAIANAGRTQNSFYFVNSTIDILPKMTVGLEVSYWQTKYRGLAPGNAAVFEFTGSYAF